MKFVLSISLLIALLTLSLACKKEGEIIECGTCLNCDLEPNVGPCNAYFIKYYFDKVEGKCKEFGYGGCGGTVPFETLEDCEACGCTN